MKLLRRSNAGSLGLVSAFPNPTRNRALRENIHIFFRFLRHHLRLPSTSFVGGFPLSFIGMGFVLRKLALAFGLLFLTASGSHGAPITFQFTGSVDEVEKLTFLELGVYDIVPVNSSAWFPGSVFSVGESFSGTFTYETTASGTLSQDGLRTVHSSALIAFSVAFDDYSVVLGTGGEPFWGVPSVSVVNDRVLGGGSPLDLFQPNAALLTGGWFNHLVPSLIDNSGSVFQDMSLPLNLSLGDFSFSNLGVVFLEQASQDQLHITGQLSTLDLVPIPEPNTATLLALGITGLAARQRPRRTTTRRN